MTDKDEVIMLLTKLGIGYDGSSSNTIWVEDHHDKVDGLTEYCSIAFTFEDDGSFNELVLENN